MAGKTDMLIGYHHRHFIGLPIAVATAQRRQLHPDHDLWQHVLQSTGQPSNLVGH
jgi:hypothetical protein